MFEPGTNQHPVFFISIFDFDSVWTCPEADYCAIFFLVIILVVCIFPEALGYLVLNMIRCYHNYILWGLFGGKYVPP